MSNTITFNITPREVVAQAGWQLASRSGGARKIALKFCPVCKGGSSKDEGTFFINDSQGSSYYGAFKCMRGKCNASGNFWKLIELAGADPKEHMDKSDGHRGRQEEKNVTKKMQYAEDRERAAVDRIIQGENLKTAQKGWILPSVKLHKRTPECAAYLEKRGVTAATQELYQVCSDARGNIAFPGLEVVGGKLQRAITKFRLPRDVSKGEKGVVKTWKDTKTEDGHSVGKPILVGTHLLDPAMGPLVICEGEIKAMVAHQAVGGNCASVPTGCNAHEWVDVQWDFLKEFDSIIVCADNDDGGRAMVDELTKRLPNDVKVAEIPERYNDLTDLNDAEGIDKVRAVIESATYQQTYGIVQVAAYERPVVSDEVKKNSVPSTWSTLDRELGSLQPGHLTILGGYTGQGKTKVAQNLSTSAMAKGIRILYASFEETVAELQDSFENIISGSKYLGEETDGESGKRTYAARQDIVPYLREWYFDSFYAFSGVGIQVPVAEFFKIMEIAYRRHGVRFFVIDNLMSLCSLKSTQFELISEQAEIARRAQAFAMKFDCHVLLVCHNNLKGEHANISIKPTLDSLKGSSEITFWAQNVLQLWRVPQGVKDDAQSKMDKMKTTIPDLQNLMDCDSSLSICKARGGAKFMDVYLKFDWRSMRFAPLEDSASLEKEWGWEQALPDDKYRGRRVKAVTPAEPVTAPPEAELVAAVSAEPLADDWDAITEEKRAAGELPPPYREPTWVGEIPF